MKDFSLTYLVSILSVFISSATAVFLSIIAYKQNKKADCGVKNLITNELIELLTIENNLLEEK